MRTTLDIDNDVLSAAREFAESHQSTAGKVISEWARKGFLPPPNSRQRRNRNGVPLFNFPRTGKDIIVTSELVKKLQNETE